MEPDPESHSVTVNVFGSSVAVHKHGQFAYVSSSLASDNIYNVSVIDKLLLSSRTPKSHNVSLAGF